MKEILNKVTSYKSLTKEEAQAVLTRIAKGEFNNSQIAAFVTAYMMRSITIEELDGFKDAMMDLCLKVNFGEENTIDVCGTGGDGKDTFNISTLSSIVVAATGQKVTKHGNNGVSSVCGSSNLLNNLGYEFSNNVEKLSKELAHFNICFMHAPLFHPAMKNVAPVRKELGVKTFFNMLGPMVNPARPNYQLVGVYDLKLARIYGYLYQNTGKRFTILHSLDGYDEISLTGPFKVISNDGEYVISPEELGFKTIKPEAIYGGDDIQSSSKIFENILDGRGTEAQNAVVIVNAAYALLTTGMVDSIEEGINKTSDVLLSGKAKENFKKLIEYQRPTILQS